MSWTIFRSEADIGSRASATPALEHLGRSASGEGLERHGTAGPKPSDVDNNPQCPLVTAPLHDRAGELLQCVEGRPVRADQQAKILADHVNVEAVVLDRASLSSPRSRIARPHRARTSQPIRPALRRSSLPPQPHPPAVRLIRPVRSPDHDHPADVGTASAPPAPSLHPPSPVALHSRPHPIVRPRVAPGRSVRIQRSAAPTRRHVGVRVLRTRAPAGPRGTPGNDHAEIVSGAGSTAGPGRGGAPHCGRGRTAPISAPR